MRLPPAPGPPHSPWQLLYGGAHSLRRAWWASRATRLPRPVISVGNLHWGGAGKTPLTAAVARHLRDRAPGGDAREGAGGSSGGAGEGAGQGLRLAILSRGYRSRGRGVRVVSTGRAGEAPLLGPEEAGDEPVLLAEELPGVAVVVHPDRAAAGRHALERLSPRPDLFLLDDGFSHLPLARDLDLLAFPAADPVGGGRLPPGGRLREPLASVARADAALLTGTSGAFDPGAAGTGRELARELARHGFRGPGFVAPIRPLGARTERGEALPEGTEVLLVSGVARPEGVRRSAEAVGLEVVSELRFGDHHRYPEASLGTIGTALRESGAAAVATTSKDLVKLRGRLDAPLAEIPVVCEPEPAFWSWLDDRVAALLDAATSPAGRAPEEVR